MKIKTTQDETLSAAWLIARGYTISAAARAIGRSHQHVSQVLHGKRYSKAVCAALRHLPTRPLVLRERLKANIDPRINQSENQ